MYWTVKVKILIEKDNGKQQKVSEQYLVGAESPTDAEVKITEELKGENFTVDAVTKSKVIKVVE